MKTSQEILSSVLKTTQMGQVGIRSVLDTTLNPELRQALVQQLKEYDGIETEAHNIASQRGWELKELDSAVRMMSNMVCRMKLTGADATSKISEMMIQGNTKGLVKGLRNLHRSAGWTPFPRSSSIQKPTISARCGPFCKLTRQQIRCRVVFWRGTFFLRIAYTVRETCKEGKSCHRTVT